MLRVPRPERGLLLVVGGPSGVGKSTLIKGLREQLPEIVFSVSATTRAPRPGEQDGREYHFLARDRFEDMVARGGFLEWAEVYGNLYGTPWQQIADDVEDGRVVLLDIDAQGSEQVRGRMHDAAHVMILPPDRLTLETRLRARGTEDEATVQRRLAEGLEQLSHVGTYDYLVVNDDLETARATLVGIVLAELSKRQRRVDRVRAWSSPGHGGDSG